MKSVGRGAALLCLVAASVVIPASAAHAALDATGQWDR